MKKYITTLMMTICALAVIANGFGNKGEGESPKPVNYKEVISKIEYPKVCREKGIEGKVIVELKVDENGKVVNHKFESYPCSDLKKVVKDILPELQFKPATDSEGNAVEGRVTLPVNFQLDI